ncbi:sulfotransferase [Aliiglaciecola sp. CAU 1673]|uniref:tetratricopeptide repeat-containing sulfotransferase family protein n=1 Tax=Aliiglaciecola sp. CAU 1673 TaxID=3032595 RepID=UPI0023DCC484|nr:tetratricopeptide repeat-containing sulfotransferase family protein [Aliiglaciecola sp. CAU 1673]MDF2178714.1 sulfotransferase [Aliiglaciecola sp. CAU 1673]
MSSIASLHQQAINLINQRRYTEAHPLCVQVIQAQPGHADAYFLLGVINFELGQVAKSTALIEEAIKRDPKPEYLAHLAKAHALLGNLRQAKALAQACPPEKLDNALTLDTLGVALSRVGLHQQALQYFEKALQLDASKAAYHYNLAVSAKFCGDFDTAKSAFETAINLKPDYAQAHFALSDLGGIDTQNHHLHRLEPLYQANSDADAGLHLGHAMAKEYEALGQYDQAFAILRDCKDKKLASINYDFAEDARLYTHCQQLLLQYKDKMSQGCVSEEPIFVLGMPRSGTTLVERILSSHSEVTSAGELQDFGMAVKELTRTPSRQVLDVQTLESAYQIDFAQLGERYLQRTRAVTGQTPRFVDKLPFNFFYLDLIRRALPKAKILCLLRNPLDTCIGNFRQLFSISSPYYSYAYNLENTGRFYAAFRQWVEAFSQMQHPHFRFVDYEKLVANPEEEVRALLDFCGLSWQQACLRVEDNQTPVSTASKVQVREPINTRSVGRWRRYQAYTQELEQLLRFAGWLKS